MARSTQRLLTEDIYSNPLTFLLYVAFAVTRSLAFFLPVCYMFAVSEQVKYLKNENCMYVNLETQKCIDVFNQSRHVHDNEW